MKFNKIISFILVLIICFFISIFCYADGEAESDILSIPQVEEVKPELEVKIWADELGPIVPVDTKLTFYSELINAEYYNEFIYQWKGSYDRDTWEDIPGATNDTYSIILNGGIEYQYYKLAVQYR